jgi:transcriptional regulator with XRE-family HTH domain
MRHISHMGNPPHTTGQRLRRYRLAAGLTQEALARAADVSLPTIQRLENDRHGARLSTLGAIAEALDVPVAAFLAGPTEVATP